MLYILFFSLYRQLSPKIRALQYLIGGWMNEYKGVRNREVREMNKKFASAEVTVYTYNRE